MLAEADAVANKVAAVFSRGEERDYINLAGILASGRYEPEQLLILGAQADGGFQPGLFAQALAGVERFPDERFARYGLGTDQIAALRGRLLTWSRDLSAGR